jgi:hypothetical protein
MDIGTLLLMVAFAYGIGVFWYDLIPGQLAERPWRVAAYPFAAMVIAEAFWPVEPVFGGLHVVSAVVAGLIGVVVDWAVTRYRQPTATPTPELRPSAA